MDNWGNLIEKFGITTVCLLACGWLIWYLVKRLMDEAEKREQVADNRERTLVEANVKNSEALDKIADTIHETNELNKELSEKNRLLTEMINNKLENIDKDVNKVINLLEK